MKEVPMHSWIIKEFEKRSGLIGVRHNIQKKSIYDLVSIEVNFPSERLFRVIQSIVEDFAEAIPDNLRITIKSGSPENIIQSAETRLLLRVLSEIQNVNRFSFQNDFFLRYTSSISGAEQQIIASANHIVLGRRGAGKSMLLLFAWHSRRLAEKQSAWIDMQVFAGRSDEQVASQLMINILEQTSILLGETEGHAILIDSLGDITDIKKLRPLLPRIRKLLQQFSALDQDLFIFLDDFHVLNSEIQPKVLDAIYAITRGNKIFMKISAIETFIRTFDAEKRLGLEVPQDAQNIKLDYNLTTPDQANTQIEAILNSHAKFCGIRTIRRLCTSGDVLARLTWVAAGVPRDALYLFAQAITKASVEGRKRVSVSNVNLASSETLTVKLKDLQTDASNKSNELNELLEEIKAFCIAGKKSNAFLVSIRSGNRIFENILKLCQLRLLHVINEGITRQEAGKKYLGLILDYGFYTGIRAARSVELFNQQSGRVAYKELRALPVFEVRDSA